MRSSHSSEMTLKRIAGGQSPGWMRCARQSPWKASACCRSRGSVSNATRSSVASAPRVGYSLILAMPSSPPQTRSTSFSEKVVSLNGRAFAEADVPVIVRARPAASFHGAAAGTSSLAAHSQHNLVITLRERVVSTLSKERYLVLCEIVSACWPLEAMVVDMSSAWSGMGLDWTGLDWTALQERGLDPWESGIQAVSARCVLREHIAPLLRAKIVSSGGG